MVPNTLEQFDAIVAKCKEIYLKKALDYGTSWRILRPSSLTDQLYIKAKRIRTIELRGTQQVADSVADEFRGIVNYGIMALIQLAAPAEGDHNWPVAEAEAWYDREVAAIRDLLARKNHDYGEAWREMRQSSFTDMILVKLLRVRQIENNAGQTLVSEGLEANFQDIVNYAVFALIMLEAAGPA